MYAISIGHAEIVRVLIDKGANVRDHDKNGNSVLERTRRLHRTRRYGAVSDQPILDMLISAGAADIGPAGK